MAHPISQSMEVTPPPPRVHVSWTLDWNTLGAILLLWNNSETISRIYNMENTSYLRHLQALITHWIHFEIPAIQDILKIKFQPERIKPYEQQLKAWKPSV